LSGRTSPLKLVPPSPEPETSELIARCQAGDRGALGALYGRYRNEALRFVRHAARNSQDVEDILQEVFLEVASSIRSYAARSCFEGWLRSICVRTALRHMRRRTRQVGEADPQEAESAHLCSVGGEDPGEGFERRERARRIAGLLDQLAPKKRMVLILHDFEGISPKDISQMVGAPVLTVRTRLFYARKELASLARQDPVLAVDLAAWLETREAGT